MQTTTEAKKNGHAKKNGRKHGSEQAAVLAEMPPETPSAGKITITPISARTVEFDVVGAEDLVMNKWSEKARQQMLEQQMGRKAKAREAKDPEACFHGARYVDAHGRDCVPAAAFKKAAVAAARYCKGVKMTELRGAFFVRGHLLPITAAEPVMREDMVRNASGVADIRFRPAYPAGWRVRLTIQYMSEQIDCQSVINLFQVAGQAVGIGEMRPEKTGLQFGTFAIDPETVVEVVSSALPLCRSV